MPEWSTLYTPVWIRQIGADSLYGSRGNRSLSNNIPYQMPSIFGQPFIDVLSEVANQQHFQIFRQWLCVTGFPANFTISEFQTPELIGY
jgi:hypothetical protein